MKVKFILPALLEATDPGFRPIKYALFPPLGLASLAGYLRPDDEASLEDEHVMPLDLDDTPDLVVTWTSQAAAKAFLAAKGIEADYQVIALTDDSLGRMAKALGCEPDAIGFDAYPG